jgi:hypothetical protein
MFRLNELVVAFRFDLDRLHGGIADRVAYCDTRSQFLAVAVNRPLSSERTLPKALPAAKE